MKWIKFKYILLLIILMAMVSTMACKTKTSGETKPKTYYTIEGTITNPAGFGESNVRVEVTDYTMVDSSASKPTGLFATLTDSDGAFTLEILAYDDLGKVTLQLSKSGYTSNYLDTGVLKGLSVTVTGMIAPAGGFQAVDFSTTDENTITVTNDEASVTISRGTLVNASGATISAARVSVAPIDSTADISLLPGSQYGFVNGSLKLFSTLGMIEISAVDAKNDPANLKSGATASISVPVGSIVGSNPPETAGLWYFNEENHSWSLEGSLTLNAAKTAYQGTVSHFSTYNVGKTFDATYFKTRVVDQNGDEVYQANASFFTSQFSDDGVWQKSYTSGPEGYIPSILNTELVGIVPDNMAGYIPLPADADINVRIKYIKTSDSKKPVFLFPDLSQDADDTTKYEIKYQFTTADGVLVPSEEMPALPVPYTIRTAGAGEITPFNNVIFELETAAFMTGHVQYENGDPASLVYFRFMTSEDVNTSAQLALARTDSNGDMLNCKGTVGSVGISYTTDKNVKLPPNTEGFMVITSMTPSGGLPYISWFEMEGNDANDLENYDDYKAGAGIAKKYTTGPKGSTTRFVITLSGGNSGTTTTAADPLTYVSGIANTATEVNAPAGSWIVFRGMYRNSPVVTRAQVGADGTFPDPEGPFDVYTVVTVDGVDETLLVKVVDGEVVAVRVTEVDGEEVTEYITLGEDPQYFVQLIAGANYTVDILAFSTDPLTPDLLTTYSFTSGSQNDHATSLIIAPNAYIWGSIYNRGDIGDDLLVTFTKVDAVTECEEDDEDCEVDEPVIVISDSLGAYSAELEFDTDYIITVSEYKNTGTAAVPVYSPTNLLHTEYYTSNVDGTTEEPYDIIIGAGYREDWTVTGKVSGNYDAGVIVTFTPIKRGDTVSVITDEEGNYSVDLALSTDYVVTVETYDDTAGEYIVVYPTEEIPHECVAEGEVGYNAACTGTNFVYTSGDADSNITGEGDIVNFVVGVKAFIPFIPAGKTAIYGTFISTTGEAVASLPFGFTETGTFDIANDVIINSMTTSTVNGYDLSAAQYGALSIEGYALLNPNTTYKLMRYRYNGTKYDTVPVIESFTSGGAGQVQELYIVHNTATTATMTQTFIKGTLKNADNTAAANTTIQFIPAEGDTVDVVTGATGKIDMSALTPNTEYSVSVGGTTIISSFTSEDAGVVETLQLVIPASGEITKSYVTGLMRYDDGEETPVAAGQNVYFQPATGADTTGTIGEDGAFYTRTYDSVNKVWVANGGTLTLTPGMVYSGGFIASGVKTPYFTDITASEEGAVLTLSITLPAPEVEE